MGIYEGAGIWSFEPITDPVKLAVAKVKSAEFKKHLFNISHKMDTFGWDSQECRKARMEMAKWQREEQQDDQDAHPGNTIIKQQVSGPGVEEQSCPGISGREKALGSMDMDYDAEFKSEWRSPGTPAPISESNSNPELPF